MSTPTASRRTLGKNFTSEEYSFPRVLPTEKSLWINSIGQFWVRPADAAGKMDWIKMIKYGMSHFQLAEGGKVQAGTAPDPIHWLFDGTLLP